MKPEDIKLLENIAQNLGGEFCVKEYGGKPFIHIDTDDHTSKENYDDLIAIRDNLEKRLPPGWGVAELWADNDTQLIIFDAPLDKPAFQEHILQFFEHKHPPLELRAVIAPFCNIAHAMVENLPRNPERSVALRKLLEAKDAALRAKTAK